MVKKIKVGSDASFDVCGSRGVGGGWGALATGLFVTIGGTGLLVGNFHQVWVQLVGIGSAGAYSFIVTYMRVITIDKTIGFRVNDDDEEMELDTSNNG